MVYMKPIAPEESIVAPKAQPLTREEYIRQHSTDPDEVQDVEVPDPHDTDWWQKPLNRAIGRSDPDSVVRHYPRSIDEIDKITRGLM